MAPIRGLTAAALLLALPIVQAGDFLAGLKKVVPKSVPDLGKSHAELKKVVSQEVAKAIPSDVAEKLDVPTLKDSKGSLSDIAEGAAQGSIKDAAGSLKGSAQQSLQTFGSSSVYRDVSGAVQNVPEMVPQALDAVQSASPEGVASTLREVTPGLASTVNRTSLTLADLAREHIPKFAGTLNKTGHLVADRIDGGYKPTEKPMWQRLPSLPDLVDSPEVRKASEWGLAFVVVGVMTVAAGAAVLQRQRKSNQRPEIESGPALLSEVLEGMSPAASSSKKAAREPTIQADTAQDSLFQKF